MARPAPADVDSTLMDTELLRATVPLETAFLPQPVQAQRQAQQLRHDRAARLTLGVSAAVHAGLALWLVLAPRSHAPPIQPSALWPLVAGFALVALGATAARWLPVQRLGAAACAALAASMAMITLLAGAAGAGPAAPGLSLMGLFVVLAALTVGFRPALVLAGVGALCTLALSVGRSMLPLAVPAPPGDVTALHPLFVQWSVLGMAVALAWAHSRITERHAHAASDRERRFTGLLAIAVDWYWEVDAQFRLMAAHMPRRDGVEASVGEALGQVPWELPAFACDAETLDALQADLESRIAFRELPVRWKSRSGTVRHFSVSGEPRFDARGVFLGYWGVAREITAHVEARRALAATEGRYQNLFARIPTPLVIHRSGLIVDANPAAQHLLGYEDVASMVGRDLLDHVEGGDSRERVRRRQEELEAQPVGEALPVEDFRMRSRHGRRIAVRSTGVRVDDDAGFTTLSILVDDTERRRAEEAVRRSEALLSHLVATSPDVITLTDLATGRYAMVNQTFEQVTGYSAAEVVGRSSVEIGLWVEPDEHERFIEHVRQHGAAREMRCRFMTRSGQTVQLLMSGAVFAMDRRTYLVINGRDISQQERSRLERDAILQNASIGIAVTRDQRFVLTNPRFDEMYGWAEGGLIGQPGSAVWPSEADYRALGEAISPQLSRGELIEVERLARRRDGSTFLARVLGKAIDPSRTINGGTIWIIEDVTERRQVAEALARARDQAEAANRAKSAFLANTSHELRTPLNGMLGLAQLARDRTLDEERRQLYLDQIVDNAQALAAILSDVLDLSKIEAGKLMLEATSFDLPNLLSGLKQAYGALAAGRSLALTLDIDPSLQGPHHAHVKGDPLRVRQILSNYLANALKFTDQGSVRVVARRIEGDRVRFEVHDTGPGLDEPTQSRLFRPFTQADESTTRRFGGTGLGLSICRELAALMGGEVGVVSVPGRGACFWAEVLLPAVAGARTRPPGPARAAGGRQPRQHAHRRGAAGTLGRARGAGHRRARGAGRRAARP